MSRPQTNVGKAEERMIQGRREPRLFVDVWIFGTPEFNLKDNYWIPEGSLALQLQYAYLTMKYFKELYPQKTCELRVLQVSAHSRT